MRPLSDAATVSHLGRIRGPGMSRQFGKLIRGLREQRGLTQSDVAAQLGVTYVAVGDWERGRRLPRVENLKALANALGVGQSTLTDAIYEPEPADVVSDPFVGPGSVTVQRSSDLNLDDFEGFRDLDEESRADVAADVAHAIQRARDRQRRRENLGGSRAGRGSD